MGEPIYLLKTESSPRLERLLAFALAGRRVFSAGLAELSGGNLAGKRVLFALAVDLGGMGPDTLGMLRTLRQTTAALAGAIGSIIVDGAGELYTKQAAQSICLAANLTGCLFPGKPLVEGTGSLHNHRVSAERMNCSPEEAYFRQARALADRLAEFQPPRFSRPNLLMLHASDNRRSNTVAMGSAVCQRLSARCNLSTISLQNGAIYDCRGCSYTACLHYSKSGTCYYGGALPTEVFPAILASDGILLLCPNYNDSVSANIMALINRMTSLLLQSTLYDKYLYAIVVSGYSGGDIVARQVLGALCLNKTMMLPPRFCLFQTANDPGEAMASPGMEARLSRWAGQILDTLLIPEEKTPPPC